MQVKIYFFIADPHLETLSGSAAHNWGYSPPLGGHQFCKVEQLFIFLSGPLGLLYRWIKPFIPTGLALFRWLANEEGRDPGPLILPILHHCRLQNFILRVFPHATLDQDPHCHFVSQLWILCVAELARTIGFESPANDVYLARYVLPVSLSFSKLRGFINNTFEVR